MRVLVRVAPKGLPFPQVHLPRGLLSRRLLRLLRLTLSQLLRLTPYRCAGH